MARNHADEARGCLSWAVGDKGPQALGDDDPRLVPALQLAQVHASLAIAEELERLNDTLGDADLFLESAGKSLLRIANKQGSHE